ncbi:MAG TPA: YibE/F family protein [Clostridiales bacterium]|nr:YibE/F family protein [Clostridiales bacterium]
MKRFTVPLLILFIVSGLFCFSANAEEADSETETAIVLEAGPIIEIPDENGTGWTEQFQQVTLKVTSGKFKNQVFETINNLSGNSLYDIPVKKGDKVVVVIERAEDGTPEIFISDYMRQHYILYLSAFFVAVVLFIGKGKGLRSLITLALTMFAIFKILLPGILKGHHPVFLTVLISFGITVITFFIVSGINGKSIAAILGTTGGVMAAGILAYFVGSRVKLTGLSPEEASFLMYLPQGTDFDLQGLLFSGIIMGSLGAVMDVAISIASSIEEIHRTNPSLPSKNLFLSGMNVGKDIIGTMTNTLILAYTGSSIPLLIVFMAYETSIVKILNLDVIATEVIRSLAGSTGLVLTIPITALAAGLLIKKPLRIRKIKEETADQIGS